MHIDIHRMNIEFKFNMEYIIKYCKLNKIKSNTPICRDGQNKRHSIKYYLFEVTQHCYSSKKFSKIKVQYAHTCMLK